MTPRKSGDHPPVVYVEWVDAMSISHTWQDREEAMKTAERLWAGAIPACGLLLADTDEYIVLALAFNTNNDDIGMSMAIPKSQIVFRKQLMPAVGYHMETQE